MTLGTGFVHVFVGGDWNMDNLPKWKWKVKAEMGEEGVDPVLFGDWESIRTLRLELES